MLPYDANHAIARDKLDRYRAEADSHRLARSVRSDESSRIERLFVAIGQGLLSIGESFKRADTRPSLPAI